MLRPFAGENEVANALWWTAPLGWRGGRQPARLLDTDPEAVIDAARGTAEPLDV